MTHLVLYSFHYKAFSRLACASLRSLPMLC